MLRLIELELAAIEPTEMIVLLLVKCCGFGFCVLIWDEVYVPPIILL